MARYIDADAVDFSPLKNEFDRARAKVVIMGQPTADVVKVVRCKDCKYAVELDKHCEINRASYRHCTQGRGEEEEYVWHKYKKYFKGYSIVELDDYCSYGERRCFDE